MTKKPHILITNDDGISSEGIRHLWEAVKGLGKISIIAPMTEQSGVGLSLTWREPLHIRKVSWGADTDAWSISGTPADCVKMGISTLLKEPPDLIISGINQGANSGRNVLYSGTVAGVIEGIIQGVPGIAFSCWDFLNPNYAEAVPYIPAIIQNVLNDPLPVGTLLNVNFPSKTAGKIQGVKLTSQGKEYWAEKPEQRLHPAAGFEYYWLGARLAQFEEEEDSDIAWLRKGFAAAVPMHVGDLTDRSHLKAKKHHFDQISI